MYFKTVHFLCNATLFMHLKNSILSGGHRLHQLAKGAPGP